MLAASAAAADVIRVHHRIHCLSSAGLARLERGHDFWRIDPATGAAVFSVTDAQRVRLEAVGYVGAEDPMRQRQRDEWTGAADTRLLTAGVDTIPCLPCYRSIERTRTVERPNSDLQALAEAHPDRAEWIPSGSSCHAGAGLPHAGAGLPRMVALGETLLATGFEPAAGEAAAGFP